MRRSLSFPSQRIDGRAPGPSTIRLGRYRKYMLGMVRQIDGLPSRPAYGLVRAKYSAGKVPNVSTTFTWPPFYP